MAMANSQPYPGPCSAGVFNVTDFISSIALNVTGALSFTVPTSIPVVGTAAGTGAWALGAEFLTRRNGCCGSPYLYSLGPFPGEETLSVDVPMGISHVSGGVCSGGRSTYAGTLRAAVRIVSNIGGGYTISVGAGFQPFPPAVVPTPAQCWAGQSTSASEFSAGIDTPLSVIVPGDGLKGSHVFHVSSPSQGDWDFTLSIT